MVDNHGYVPWWTHLWSCNRTGIGLQRRGSHKQASLATNPAGNLSLLTSEDPPHEVSAKMGNTWMKCSGRLDLSWAASDKLYRSLQLLQKLAPSNEDGDQNIKLGLAPFCPAGMDLQVFQILKEAEVPKTGLMCSSGCSQGPWVSAPLTAQVTGVKPVAHLRAWNHLLTFGQDMAAAMIKHRHSFSHHKGQFSTLSKCHSV